MSNRLWRIAVVTPDAGSADAMTLLLGDHAAAISSFELAPDGDWLVQGFAETKPEPGPIGAGVMMAALAHGHEPYDIEIEPLEDIDWLRRNQESFPPMRIGRFFVHGGHIASPQGGSVTLRIDAATAFGTGEHATTRGCLLALDRVARRGRRRQVLDMGTGTGILAIAAAKLWRRTVFACDIDPHSVAVARENAGLNGVASLVACRTADGYQLAELRRSGGFDLIFANILARPLARMAPDLARHLQPGGIAILSGLLADQERFVASTHMAQGLRFVARIPINGWHTLIFERP